MRLRFLLDTNVLSEPTRPTPSARVLDQLRRHTGTLATASVVWHELWSGVRRLPGSRRRTLLESYLHGLRQSDLEILEYGSRAADWHATERARLSGQGISTAFADGQVAAVAATSGLVLVTRNTRDFAMFSGLEVEDWWAD